MSAPIVPPEPGPIAGPERLAAHTVALAQRLFSVSAARLVWGDGVAPRAWAAFREPADAELDGGPGWDALLGDAPIAVVADAVAHPASPPGSAVGFLARLRLGRDALGEPITLWLIDRAPRALSDDQCAGLDDLAALAAAALATSPPAPPSPFEDDILRMRALLRNATDLVAVNDAQGIVQYISPSVTRILGYQPAELIGKPSFSLLHPDDLPQIVASFRASAQHAGLNPRVTMRFRATDGSWRMLDAASTNLLDDPHVRGVVVNARDVTAEWHLEQERRESEERYRRLVDLSPDMVAVISDGRFQYLNRAGLQLLGADDATQLIGRAVAELIAPADLPRMQSRRQQLLEGDALQPSIYRLTALDGQARLLEVNSARISYAGASASLVVARDVSERIEHEQQRRFQASVLAQMSDAVVAIDAAGHITYMNIAAERQYGRTFAQMRGERLGTLYRISYLHPSDEAAAYAAMARDGLWRGMCRHHTLAGRTLEIEAAVVALRSDDGLPNGMVAVLHDVTGRNQAEQRLRLLESVVVHAHDAVLITEAYPTDPPGPRIWYANAAFLRMSGYALDEVIGRTPRMLQGPGTDPQTLAKIRAALEALRPIRVEILNYTKAGRTIWVDLSIAPVTDPSGQTTHFVSIQRDITARKLLEAQLQQAQKLESIGRLAGGVAHDFNNLLTAVGGYADLAMEATSADAPIYADLLEIRRGVDRATNLTRQLLTFARQQPHAPRMIQINHVILGLKSLLRQLLGVGVALQTQLAPDLPPVVADLSQIEQVLINLAVNARDAMPDGGALTIATDLRPGPSAGAVVQVRVSDTGHGMSEETQARAFEPFFTTKPPGEGTGLGLATCYGILQQHGGALHIHSRLGQGTTISIDLPAPAAVPGQAPAGEQPAPPTAAALPTALPGATVLVVDDERPVRALAARIMRAAGYRVLEATTGFEALEIVQALTPAAIQLVLSDIHMPEMNGRVLAARLAAAYPGLRVLLMSGNPRLGDVPASLAAPTALLAKPFSVAALLHAVDAALKGASFPEP